MICTSFVVGIPRPDNRALLDALRSLGYPMRVSCARGSSRLSKVIIVVSSRSDRTPCDYVHLMVVKLLISEAICRHHVPINDDDLCSSTLVEQRIVLHQ